MQAGVAVVGYKNIWTANFSIFTYPILGCQDTTGTLATPMFG